MELSDALVEFGGQTLVYVRAAKACDVLKDQGMTAKDAPYDIDPDTTWYAVHSASDGQCIAVMDDREAAFAAARAHALDPVSVH